MLHLLKMLKFIFASALISWVVVAAVTIKNNDTGTITKFTNQINTDGTYGFDIGQSNGLQFKEIGFGGHYAKGAYQYVSPEGQKISVVYSADDTGFYPQSQSIPTPPPIPSYILKALRYINEHPTAQELADRKVRAKQV